MADGGTEGQPIPPKANGTKPGGRSRNKDGGGAAKRKCVSTACIACRKRKSKCDGNTPSCAACASVYGTECVYDPNSDHRRKGVYKKGIDSSKTQDSTLKTLIEGILNYSESEVLQLVREIRQCDSLEDVAQTVSTRNVQLDGNGNNEDETSATLSESSDETTPRFERELAGKVGELRLDTGATQYLGGTSNLLYVDNEVDGDPSEIDEGPYATQEDAIRSWTTVTTDTGLILHLLYMYFTWHYTYFTTLSRSLFFRDFLKGKPTHLSKNKPVYCTPLLVNAMLTLGCHFTSWPAARADPDDSATAGDHFLKECKRILVEKEEYEVARMATVQALALMSVREAGCAREAKGWFYSGMSFRMACDMGLPYEYACANLSEEEVDARRMTFWGCYLFDKCWSNYLGRPPQLSLDNITLKKYDVFPLEDADVWSPWTDSGLGQANVQPARTRAVSLQISALCEISSDLLQSFYRPNQVEKPLGKQAELKKLSDLHTRLEAWRKDLPKEFEAKEGQLPQVLIMHMFFYLLFIHLFRPFLKYTQGNTPLPAHVSPRKHCIQAAAAISKLLRLYKKTHGLRQICNIAVYITHSACTIHLLNLQDKDARRDLVYGLRHLEEISESWLCARRTLNIIVHQIEKWQIEVPSEAKEVLDRAEAKFQFRTRNGSRSNSSSPSAEALAQSGGFGSDNPLSPTTLGRFDFSPQNGLAPQRSNGQPPISATARVRTNSSAQRSELLRQMQQNTLQTQINSRGYPYSSSPDSDHKWNDNMWKTNLSINAVSAASAPGLVSTQQSQQNGHEQPESTGSPTNSTIASPTLMFAGQQQQKALSEEQREWWLRDQTSLFVNWMRRESISGTSNDSNTPSATNSGPNGSGLMGMDIYTCLADTAPVTTGANGFGCAGPNDPVMPPGWDSFNLQGNASAQQGNSNFGGFNTGVL